MRPRERSYGDISTLTRSPTRMRMRCLRILPEIAASTTCVLLSSCTLKKALGCLSIIVPSAGTKSSFAKRFLLGTCVSSRQPEPIRSDGPSAAHCTAHCLLPTAYCLTDLPVLVETNEPSCVCARIE